MTGIRDFNCDSPPQQPRSFIGCMSRYSPYYNLDQRRVVTCRNDGCDNNSRQEDVVICLHCGYVYCAPCSRRANRLLVHPYYGSREEREERLESIEKARRINNWYDQEYRKHWHSPGRDLEVKEDEGEEFWKVKEAEEEEYWLGPGPRSAW